MKYLRRLLVILMIIGVGCLFFVHRMPVQWAGEASMALVSYYNVKKADEINSREISVYVNDQRIQSGDKEPDVYMSDTLELMAAPEVLTRIFGYEITSLSDGKVSVSSRDKSYIFDLNSEQVASEAESFSFPKALVQKDNTFYIAVHAVSMAFEQGYRWDGDTNSAYITVSAAPEVTLPEAYDMRTDGRVSRIRSQGSLGTCWAFAALSAFESTLMPGERLELAVDHLSILNGFNISQNDGGDYNMALAYMAAWKGPVFESDDPYGDQRTDESLQAVKHLQEAVNIGSKDYDTIKRMVYMYGGVQSSFYSDIEVTNVSSQYYNMNNASYFYNGSQQANHDIVIVGWDDHYSKYNFNITPSSDGAFICRNSWGSAFGDEGYFYISYEDANIGVNNLVYTRIDDAHNYDKIYQSDLLGWIGAIGYNEPSAWFANVYNADGFEGLKAVSFYATGRHTAYEVYAVPEFASADDLKNRVFVKSGYIEDAGYYTVDFEKSISVSGKFAVLVKISTEDAVHPVAIEYNGGDMDYEADLADGEGYISFDGRQWQNVEENYDCNICLKAFTNKIK